MADLFLAIAVVIVFCTGWRARTIVNSLREVKRRHKGAAMHEHGVLVLSLAPLDSRRGALQGSATELHSAAWYQVLLLIRDAPYLLCLLIGVVFFWRVPHLHHQLADAEIFAVNKDDDYEYDGTNVHSINAFLARLNIAAGHAVRGIFDLPCAVLAALLCCTWRNNEVTTFVHREWNSSSLWESLHIFTVKQVRPVHNAAPRPAVVSVFCLLLTHRFHCCPHLSPPPFFCSLLDFCSMSRLSFSHPLRYGGSRMSSAPRGMRTLPQPQSKQRTRCGWWW